MTKPYRVGVCGGTFDHFHVGHALLLETAARLGQEVRVGVTTANYLAEHPKPFGERLQPFATRRSAVVRHLNALDQEVRWRVVPLNDAFGGSLERGVDLLVASTESAAGARRVNSERRRLRLPALAVEKVPLLRADDLLPVSSRRIRAGLIDRRGRRLRPLRIALIQPPGAAGKLPARTVKTIFPKTRVRVIRRSAPEPFHREGFQSLLREGFDYVLRLRPARFSGGIRPRNLWKLEAWDSDGPVRPGRAQAPANDLAAQLEALFAPRGARREEGAVARPVTGKGYRRPVR
ncbi:MAG: pantetheine-phosphate adenylyltransferase [Thermoplasmata archaeon]|nr:pantetheine-phosphate adenylyltransferase [Thermoplasmata archaeon]